MSTNRRVHVKWLGEYKTDISIRGVHHIKGDEMPQYGGEDAGPMPTELLLASVASCMCLAVYHFAAKSRLDLGKLEVGASADKDLVDFRFNEIRLHVVADLPAGQLDKLVDRAKGYCFVSNTIVRGCPIQIETESTHQEEEAA